MLHEAILAIALTASAFFAIYFEEATYAVASFGIMLILLSALYFSLNAPFAAVFQLAIGVGTIAVLFLTGEMLTRKTEKTKTLKKRLLGLGAAILLSIPSIITTGGMGMTPSPRNLSFFTALWEIRAPDVMAQGLVVLIVAIGVAMILKRKG